MCKLIWLVVLDRNIWYYDMVVFAVLHYSTKYEKNTIDAEKQTEKNVRIVKSYSTSHLQAENRLTVYRLLEFCYTNPPGDNPVWRFTTRSSL